VPRCLGCDEAALQHGAQRLLAHFGRRLPLEMPHHKALPATPFNFNAVLTLDRR
jgi:hypothetical protein